MAAAALPRPHSTAVQHVDCCLQITFCFILLLLLLLQSSLVLITLVALDWSDGAFWWTCILLDRVALLVNLNLIHFACSKKCFPPRISLVSSLAVDSLLNYSLDHSLCCLLTQIETDWRAGLWRQLCAALQLCHSSLSLPR